MGEAVGLRPEADDVHGDDRPAPGVIWEAVPKVEAQPPARRVFVPSTLDDNPALIARDPGYRARMLAGISNRALRQALATGDWDAIDQIEGALWDWAWIEPRRVVPKAVDGHGGGLVRVVVAVDPAASSNKAPMRPASWWPASPSMAGPTCLPIGSCRLSPDGWGQRVVAAYREFGADRIAAERNNGGDMVTHVIRTVDSKVPVHAVWAARGKVTRAEPVAALYEQGRVPHAGAFPNLEEQLTTWVPTDGASPDRLDALVWALTDLMLAGEDLAMDHLGREGRRAEQTIAMLRSLDDVADGGPVSELRHALQVATRARSAGADEDLVLGALLHDVGKVFGDEGHGPIAAALLEAHVRPDVVEVVRHHAAFTARHWRHLGPGDPDPRDMFADRDWYPTACIFVDDWDMQSFDPQATPDPLEAFEPMIRRRLTGP